MAVLRETLPAVGVRQHEVATQRRVLSIACGAHALHDGYTDLIYVLLPVWQAEFALSYAALGALRMLYTGAMAGLQVPATLLARRFGADDRSGADVDFRWWCRRETCLWAAWGQARRPAGGAADRGRDRAGDLRTAPLPLVGALACLPLIGVALNGTSSVLNGTVPELVAPAARERAFGLFYTGTIGGGAIAPVLYGLVGDAIGPAHAIMVVAAVCLATLPLAWALSPSLQNAGPTRR